MKGSLTRACCKDGLCHRAEIRSSLPVSESICTTTRRRPSTQGGNKSTASRASRPGSSGSLVAASLQQRLKEFELSEAGEGGRAQGERWSAGTSRLTRLFVAAFLHRGPPRRYEHEPTVQASRQARRNREPTPAQSCIGTAVRHRPESLIGMRMTARETDKSWRGCDPEELWTPELTHLALHFSTCFLSIAYWVPHFQLPPVLLAIAIALSR